LFAVFGPLSAVFMERNSPKASADSRAKAVEKAKAKMLRDDPLLANIIK